MSSKIHAKKYCFTTTINFNDKQIRESFHIAQTTDVLSFVTINEDLIKSIKSYLENTIKTNIINISLNTIKKNLFMVRYEISSSWF